MTTETDDETIMQAWFGSPMKTLIAIAGFLSIGLVAYTFIGGNSSGTVVEQQSSSRVNEATAAIGYEAIFGKWSFENCIDSYIVFSEGSSAGFMSTGRTKYTASYSGNLPEIIVTQTSSNGVIGVTTFLFIDENQIKPIRQEINGKEYSTARRGSARRCN